jgi:hypothetical protein
MKLLEFKPPERQVPDNIVAICEQLLSAAKAGSLVGLACVWEYPEGGSDCKWTFAPGCRPAAILGELTTLQVKMVQECRVIYAREPPLPSGGD